VNLEKVTGQERPNVVGISQIPRWNYYKPLSPLLDVTTVTPPPLFLFFNPLWITLSGSSRQAVHVLPPLAEIALCGCRDRLRRVKTVWSSYDSPPCDYFSFVSYLCEGWLRLNRADLWALSRNNSDTLSWGHCIRWLDDWTATVLSARDEPCKNYPKPLLLRGRADENSRFSMDYLS
jgi:hypothetical protein